MLITVFYLALLTQVSGVSTKKNACVPNTHFYLNDKICMCEKQGWWTNSSCRAASRRTCSPGQILWQGCSQCICQENGQLQCNDAGCYDEATYRSGLIMSTSLKTLESQDSSLTWCTPFKSYYVNCSICVCPASGRTSDAHCATDNSCQSSPPSTSDFIISVNKNVCIPRVMYLFPCLHCLCSDGGYFVLDNCIQTCHRAVSTESSRRCISRTFYRKNCNVCWCSHSKVPDNELCTKSACNKNSKFKSIKLLKSVSNKCDPYKFIAPQCLYCTCNMNGKVNENSCLHLECLKLDDFKYDVEKDVCSPGEMVPVCLDCFCTRTGKINSTYCSNSCSYRSKLNVMEKVLKDNEKHGSLIEHGKIERTSDQDNCTPNSMYLDQGRYCLCPDNGSTNFKLCTVYSYTENKFAKKISEAVITRVISKDMNMSCTPNTFVEIDCNTCYCSKRGLIDSKWCTYDDCQAKQKIQNAQKNYPAATTHSSHSETNHTCNPGSILKEDCNFCICPMSGLIREKACTRNKCSEIENVPDGNFVCEPLAYYLVDCNVCLCPYDGVKNVEKCTKKLCEKNFLRSDSCLPGQIFSNDCNVCVCPPNGNKSGKVCTQHKCSELEGPWKKIFRISQNLLSRQSQQYQSEKRTLDVCFSGEEYEVGCKVCVCPDVGLKSYATCTDVRCQENNNNITLDNTDAVDISNEFALVRAKRETCITYNLTDSYERKECTPGSMYIIRCRQCICPYMGHINYFCRPLPKGMYCERPYPYINFMPMGRRLNGNITNLKINKTMSQSKAIDHVHTKYNCTRPGKISDDCFMCECDEKYNAVIEEHCFKSDAKKCKSVNKPSFLENANFIKVILE